MFCLFLLVLPHLNLCVYEIVQVIVPSTGKLALDMMCGEWGASRCSPKKWFAFMGDAAGNPFVPFPINYITEKVDDLTPLNPPIIPCNKAINVSNCKKSFVFAFRIKNWVLEFLVFFVANFQNNTLPCACVDCEQSCPKPPPIPPPPKPFTFFGLDGYKVCMTVLFIVLSILFLIGVCLYPTKSIDSK